MRGGRWAAAGWVAGPGKWAGACGSKGVRWRVGRALKSLAVAMEKFSSSSSITVSHTPISTLQQSMSASVNLCGSAAAATFFVGLVAFAAFAAGLAGAAAAFAGALEAAALAALAGGAAFSSLALAGALAAMAAFAGGALAATGSSSRVRLPRVPAISCLSADKPTVVIEFEKVDGRIVGSKQGRTSPGRM